MNEALTLAKYNVKIIVCQCAVVTSLLGSRQLVIG